VKIDTDLMENGKTVASQLGLPKNAGIPWMVILDSTGTPLITSDGPMGNIGYPFEPHEIDHFVVMLQKTARRSNEDRISEIESMLRKAADERRSNGR